VVSILLALWIIIGLIALLAIASLIPFSLCAQGVRLDDSSGFRAAFHWPWRTFGVGVNRNKQGFYIQLLCGNRCLYERKRQKKPGKKKKKEEKKEKKKSTFSLLRDRVLLVQLIKAGLRFLRDLLLCFRRPRLAGDIEVGFSDPAAMGMLCGIFYAVSSRGMMLDELRIRPSYVDTTFTGQVDFDTGARPASLAFAFIKLIPRLPIGGLLRLLKRRRRAAKEKEES
jgi:hypothetical protein